MKSKKIATCIITIALFAGCAFKMEDADLKSAIAERQQQNRIIQLFNSVRSEAKENVQKNIASLSKEDLNAVKFDGRTLLEAALERGHPEIVKLLLDFGASPFRAALESNARPFQKIRNPDFPLSSLLANHIASKYVYILKENSHPKTQWNKLRDKLGLECTDLLNLHSFYNMIMWSFPDEVAQILSDNCTTQINKRYYKQWLTGEVVGLIKGNSKSFAMLSFLRSFPEFHSTNFDLPTEGGSITISPRSLILLALKDGRFQGDRTKLLELIEYFPTNHAENIVYNIYPFNHAYALSDDGENFKFIANKVHMALSHFFLSQHPNCYLACSMHSLKYSDIIY